MQQTRLRTPVHGLFPSAASFGIAVLLSLSVSATFGQSERKVKRPPKGPVETKKEAVPQVKPKKNTEDPKEKEEKTAQWIMETLEYGINKDRRDAINKVLTIKDSGLRKKLGEKIVDVLDTESDPEVTVKAITILGDIKETRGIDQILKRIDDPSEEVRTAAVYGLKNLKAESSKGRLMQKMEKEDLGKHTNFIEALINTLGAFKAREMLPFTEKAIDSDKTNSAVREYLVLFLGSLESDAPKKLLLKLYRDEDEETTIRCYAVNSLARLKLKDTTGDIKQVLGEIESYGFEKRKKYYNLYIYSVAALASMGDSEAVPKLMNSLRSDNTAVRLKAVNIMRDLKNERTIDILKYRMKNDPSRKVRRAARAVLKEFGIDVGEEEKNVSGQEDQSED
jgi:HEAT repeat protein